MRVKTEAFKILKRIAYYLLFVIASTVCFNALVSLALTAYTDEWGTLTYDLIASTVYVKVLYAFVSFGVAIVAQACLIKKPTDVESGIYPWLLIVYFGVWTIVCAYVLTRGLLSINQEIYNKNPSFLIYPMVVSLLFSVTEAVYGIICLLRSKHTPQTENSPTQDSDDGDTDE